MICHKKKLKKPLKFHALFSELPMFKPKLLSQFKCLRLKTKVAGKAFNVSFPVVIVTTVIYIDLFFGQKSAFTMFLTRSQTFSGSMRTFSCMRCIVLDTLYYNLWSLNQWINHKKYYVGKIRACPMDRNLHFNTTYAKSGRISFLLMIFARNWCGRFLQKGV